jgi:phospholipid-binding lipoprotein MlaA
MVTRRNAARLLAPIAGFALLSACATPGQYRLAERDPLEKLNRGIWAVNQGADKVVIKPVTQVYRAVAPRPVRQGVTNFFANLSEPWSFVNNLLQGQPKRAAHNLGRFVVNSTIGIGGLFDQATRMGIRPAYEDLGQTMAVWGINGGPYLVLPLLGPSTMRDGIGSGVAAYADPVKVAINQANVNVWYKRGFLATEIVSARSDLIESGADTFLQSSLDPYASARSAYLQVRQAEILNQDNGADAGGAGVPAPTGEPAPGGEVTPATPGAPLPASAAPLPGDAPAAVPSATPQPSAAPLPGDDAPAPADKPKA